jgi:hypothetical protein
MQQAPPLRQVLSKYPLSMAHVYPAQIALGYNPLRNLRVGCAGRDYVCAGNELVVTSGFIFSNNEALPIDVVKQLIHKKAGIWGQLNESSSAYRRASSNCQTELLRHHRASADHHVV